MGPGSDKRRNVMRGEHKVVKDNIREPLFVEVEKGGVEIVDHLAAEWRALCDEAPNDQPFYRPEWIRAYLGAFAPKERVVLITVRIRGRLKAVLPLVEERTYFCGMPLTKLRGAAGVHSCRFDIVRGAGAEGEAAVQALWGLIKDLPGWDVLELPDVPEGGAAEQLLLAAQLDGFSTERKESRCNPYLPLVGSNGGKDSWFADTSAKFRANLRRRTHNLGSQGALHLRRVEHFDPVALQVFYDLEQSGWKGREGSAIACNQQMRRFYDEITQGAGRFGYLSLYFLESNGHVVGSHLGLTYRGCYFVPKLAYNEDYKRYAPGHLTVRAVLGDCAKRGLSEFDFLGPWMEWKGEWTSKTRPLFDCYIFHGGLTARALHAVEFTIKGSVRHMLGRK